MYTYMDNFVPLYSPLATGFSSPFMNGFMLALLPLILIVALWSIALKGYALWHAARHNQPWWFVALLLVNTLGLLEIIYLVWFCPTTSDTIRHLRKTPQAHAHKHEPKEPA